MSRNLASGLLLTALLAGCEQLPNDVAQSANPPSYTFVNAPAELPNVLRSGGRVISAFLDFEANMLVLVGAPADPTADRICGGTEPRQFIPVQWVGDFDDIVKQLALLESINILVYAPIPPTPFSALCQTTPIAVGTGRYLRSDNDFFGAFGRANAVVEHVQGTVTLGDGAPAILLARFYALGSPEGVLTRFETTIQLQPVQQ